MRCLEMTSEHGTLPARQKQPDAHPVPSKDGTHFMAHPDMFTPMYSFVHRHLGPTDADIQEMLATLGLQSLGALVDGTVPADIRLRHPLAIPAHRNEQEVLDELRAMATRNRIYRSLIGMGYYDCVTPGVVQRNVFENPAWYTQYTRIRPKLHPRDASRRSSTFRRWWQT